MLFALIMTYFGYHEFPCILVKMVKPAHLAGHKKMCIATICGIGQESSGTAA